MDHGAVRNLEQIQENDEQPRTPRAVSLALVGLGGACIVLSAIALSGRKAAQPEKKADPLGELVLARGKAPPVAAVLPTQLGAHEVTFPGILSDDAKPTTALAAVRAQPAAAAPPPAEAAPAMVVKGAPTAPPPPTDRLPVVVYPEGTPTAPPVAAAPLPAQALLEATPVVTHPRDALTKAATDSAQMSTAGVPAVAAGHDGGYQLQVSSFRSETEAGQFADQLRARGHKAYVLEAHVTGRGTWYRVRVGPFPTQHAAAAYRSTFEAKEHVVPFIVPPASKGGAGGGGGSADH
jgi:cell division septation protein DedD